MENIKKNLRAGEIKIESKADNVRPKPEFMHDFLYKNSESTREILEKKMQIRNKVFEGGSLFKKVKIE